MSQVPTYPVVIEPPNEDNPALLKSLATVSCQVGAEEKDDAKVVLNHVNLKITCLRLSMLNYQMNTILLRQNLQLPRGVR